MPKDIAASIHQRLLNLAKESGRPFNELLQYFAMERFLYRLSQSGYVDSFILKGALLFRVWAVPDSRATRDIDFLAFVDNSVDVL
ncbi:MAG: nucleotidyl transferase AbiEii/AbiGii toxin family protein, partial [Pseudomonadales bacterium]